MGRWILGGSLADSTWADEPTQMYCTVQHTWSVIGRQYMGRWTHPNVLYSIPGVSLEDSTWADGPTIMYCTVQLTWSVIGRQFMGRWTHPNVLYNTAYLECH
jgi:hypothetical protein